MDNSTQLDKWERQQQQKRDEIKELSDGISIYCTFILIYYYQIIPSPIYINCK